MCLAEGEAEANEVLGRATVDIGFDSVSVVRVDDADGVSWCWTQMCGEPLAPDSDHTAAKCHSLAPLDSRTLTWILRNPRTLSQAHFLARQPDVFREYLNVPRDFSLAPWQTVVSFPCLGKNSDTKVGIASTTKFETLRDRLDDARFLAELYSTLRTYDAREAAPGDEEDVRLSDRQITCLRWAAAGKSYDDIGDILGITERTVRHHLDRARELYGFGTIMQTIVRAAVDHDFDPLDAR